MRAPFFAALLVAATAFLMAACGEGEGVTPGPTPSPRSTPTAPGDGQTAPADGLPVDFESIDMGQDSGVIGQQPQVFKIETEGEWEEFWGRHQAIVTPQPALPAVDFSREMVIAAVDQQERSGGYRFEITGIEAVEGGLTVQISKGVPGPGCIVTAAITQPFHIVRTARSGLEPQLAMSEETVSCD